MFQDRTIENEYCLTTLKYISSFSLHSYHWDTLLDKWLDFANSTLCLGNLEAMPYIINCLEQILSYASDFDCKKTQIFDVIKNCRSCIRDSKKIELYWKALDKFTSFVISQDFLRFFENKEYISEVLFLSISFLYYCEIFVKMYFFFIFSLLKNLLLKVLW